MIDSFNNNWEASKYYYVQPIILINDDYLHQRNLIANIIGIFNSRGAKKQKDELDDELYKIDYVVPKHSVANRSLAKFDVIQPKSRFG